MMKYLTLFILSVSCVCFSKEQRIKQFNDVDLPNKAIEISYQKNGKIKQVIMSSWIDRIKTSNGKVYRKYEQGYNYKKKKGFLKVYDLDGSLLEEKWSKNIDGGVTREELLIAFDLFKKNKIVQKHFNESQLDITIHGGFNYQDKRKCKPGNRCVHIFAATAETAILAHSVIRLSDLKVVYPDYDMDNNAKIVHVKGM